MAVAAAYVGGAVVGDHLAAHPPPQNRRADRLGAESVVDVDGGAAAVRRGGPCNAGGGGGGAELVRVEGDGARRRGRRRGQQEQAGDEPGRAAAQHRQIGQIAFPPALDAGRSFLKQDRIRRNARVSGVPWWLGSVASLQQRT